MDDLTIKIFDSWNKIDNVCHTMPSLLTWLQELSEITKVHISETEINKDSFWYYTDQNQEIRNRKNSFFSITGIRHMIDKEIISEQPIIIQSEIGFLGIIAKEINGVLHFLMQAKIEPGNINRVQLSPTIQATRSNFSRAHGGLTPVYFEFFCSALKNGNVIYDQIQSEQGSRFVGKRNRNVIIQIDGEIEVYPNYKWMTLGQIKALMRCDNIVNMDTRTVLSGLLTILNKNVPYEIADFFEDKAFFNSFIEKSHTPYTSTLAMLNNYKMYHDVTQQLMPLSALSDWEINQAGIFCKKTADFEVRYYDIEIEGREVQRWSQPLFKATSEALFVLYTANFGGTRKFLVQLMPEVGCFDKVEFGPSIQIPNNKNPHRDALYELFLKYENDKKHIWADVMLSEEGGRFYHEQNRNIIIDIDPLETGWLSPDNFAWVEYSVLNRLVAHNNLLNIQLRNLMSLLDIQTRKETPCA